MNPVFGLIPINPFPFWVTVKQTSNNTGALMFGHGIVFGFSIIAAFILCCVSIWIKRRIVRYVYKANRVNANAEVNK